MRTTFKTATVEMNPGTITTTWEDAKRFELLGKTVRYETRTIDDRKAKEYRWDSYVLSKTADAEELAELV